MQKTFEQAINSMNGDFREPESFLDYLARYDLQNTGTANSISIQSHAQLATELKVKNIMVFRLGSRKKTKGTYFALIKSKLHLKDYFLFDEILFRNTEIITLNVDWKTEEMISFSVISKLTETSHVNLALATGLLQKALSLDNNDVSIPATGRGSYTFNVRPKRGLDLVWEHNAGQVEIDSILAGQRNGQKHIFVIEAKSGNYPDSLSNHKLIYPISAIAPSVPDDYLITPIYMKIIEDNKSIVFNIAECESYKPKEDFFIDSLNCTTTKTFKILK